MTDLLPGVTLGVLAALGLWAGCELWDRHRRDRKWRNKDRP